MQDQKLTSSVNSVHETTDINLALVESEHFVPRCFIDINQEVIKSIDIRTQKSNF